MKQRTKKWLGIGAVAAVVLLADILVPTLKPETLQDFEQRCMKTADPLKRQEIALEAVKFLIHEGAPDTIVQEIDQAATVEKLTPTLAREWGMADSVAMNDSLWAVCESRLSQFLPALFYYLKQFAGPDIDQTQLAHAKNLAEKIDTYTRYSYWVPLIDFFNKTDSTTWRRWRVATISASKSRDAYNRDEFKLARFYAICGLHNLSGIPDRRLYLDLCLRLQNAIAYDEADFSIALAFGEWITQESLKAKYYLRAVSMDFNLGDQFSRIGRNDEAIEKFKNVLNLITRWHYIPNMEDWYKPRTLERLSLAMHRIGEHQASLRYLEPFGQSAQNPREKALYHMGQGLAAKSLGEYEKAEREYLKVIEAAKNNDIANTWYANFNLAELFLMEYDLPEKALKYLEEGKSYVENREKDFFNNSERMSYYLLLKTKVQINKGEAASARETLRRANRSIQDVNSSRLYVDSRIIAATLYQRLNEPEEAKNQLVQALEFCRARGLFLEELGVILKQAELSTSWQTGVQKTIYPVEALSQVIQQLQKNGDKLQLIQAHAFLAETAYKAGRYDDARRQVNLLLEQTEALSRQYDHEERLTFFQHSVYKNIKSAIQVDILSGRLDSAFVKLNYIKGRALRGKLMGPKTPYLDIASLQKTLQNNEALLDYMVTADTLYAYILTRSGLRLRRIAESKQNLQRKVEAYISYLQDDYLFEAANNEKQFRDTFLKGVHLANELYNAVFEKIAHDLQEVDHLFIIPDEALYAVPFNTLALKDGIDTRFLIEDKATMVLPGAWILAAQSEKQGMQEKILLASIDSTLPGAKTIEKKLRAMFGNGIETQTQWEDKNSFKKYLAMSFPTYLFYAHAEANWDEPRESYIEFPLKSPNHNGWLSYQDIDSLDWRKAALVILAGCETSGSRIYLGAGLTGLQRAFLAAGASQVLATYWKVDARLVADQIPNFLETWNRHHDALLALQVMQKMAITALKNDPFFKYPHPRLWGAYNLTGNRPMVDDANKMAMN